MPLIFGKRLLENAQNQSKIVYEMNLAIIKELNEEIKSKEAELTHINMCYECLHDMFNNLQKENLSLMSQLQEEQRLREQLSEQVPVDIRPPPSSEMGVGFCSDSSFVVALDSWGILFCPTNSGRPRIRNR